MGYGITILALLGGAVTLGGLYLLQNKEKQQKVLDFLNSL